MAFWTVDRMGKMMASEMVHKSAGESAASLGALSVTWKVGK